MFLWHYYLALPLLITIQIYKAQGCDEFTDLDLSHAIIGTSLKIRLLLYTRDNVTCGTLMSHTNLHAHPQFNLSRPTTFIIHGYRPTGSPPMWLQNITEMVLAREDVNIIVVDWNYGAANVNYFKAVENTHKAADNLTAFIKKMKEHGSSMSSIHMIGVSLGAHISGFVGAKLNGSIGRITALDPAGPQFTGTSKEDRLDPTNAQFVDVLHTDMDALGFREPLGHIDFYANGGADQPGCPRTILSVTGYTVDVVIWNRDERWGYITVKLHGDDGKEAVATIDHKALKFKSYTETKLFAQFDKDIQLVKKVSLKFSNGNAFKPKYKLRVLRLRLTHLEEKKRPLCRYDIILEESKEVTFRPIPCEESNF
ncbi:Lipase member H [Collichthys lucidus]|uniref:Lipase member H n=1 Tax=Collichthys lucidus TaxID=240159 RepID=A0A4U5V5U1_COLLU|nr:Lipase member H [Collichthys lucidus]